MTVSEQQQIQDYLAGKMGSRAMALFEEKIANDPELSAAVETARAAFQRADAAASDAKPAEPTRNDGSPAVPSHPTGEPTAHSPSPKSNFNGYALLFVGLLLLGWMIYNRYFRPKGNFDHAFSFPESIVRDLEVRYANNPDTVEMLPATCLDMLHRADKAYQNKQFETAQEVLLLLALEENTECRSDAYFYLALLALQNNNPELAMQCFPKIEAYSRFGNDIQWYMTLAFVQMAENDDDLTEHAVRALQRIETSGQSEERKTIAREILSRYQ